MKRRITLSVALALVVISLSLTRSDSTANAQQQGVFKIDTGVVPLGPGQVLSVTAGALPPTLSVVLRFRQFGYSLNTCIDGICKHSISSQTISNPVGLAPGEAASFTSIPDSVAGVRVVVLSNSRDVRVNALIIDSATGQVDSVIDLSGYFAH